MAKLELRASFMIGGLLSILLPCRATSGEAGLSESRDPPERHDIPFPTAPEAWHLGIPLGNGETGAMVWGDGAPLILTLDRYDLWESRTWEPDPLRYNYDTWRELIESGRASEIREEFQVRHWQARAKGEHPSPTRLPAGRLEIRMAGGQRVRSGVLDLRCAEAVLACAGSGRDAGGSSVRILAQATTPVIAVCIEGPLARSATWSLVPARLSDAEVKRLEGLGYSKPVVGGDPATGWRTLRWTFNGDKEMAAAVQARRSGEAQLLLALSLRTAPAPRAGPGDAASRSGTARETAPAERASEAVRLAREDVTKFLERGWRRMREEHLDWWKVFWDASWIEIPDTRLEALWYRELYKLGSLSRPGKYPISLQGVWTRDGGLPPWAGDYHLDMNVQETYWPVYASNHLDLGLPLYEQFLRNLPGYRRMCREFFGFDGCYTRCEQALDGSEIFGYYTTNFWAGNGAWLAHHFWLHWRYSLDFEFLSSHAYPFLRSCMDLYLGLLEKGDDGYYHIPVTNSPEFHEDRDSAWGRDDAGNLSLIRFLAEALLEADRILGRKDPARARWQEVLANLAPLPGTARDPLTGEILYSPRRNEGILVMADRPYDIPHRHMTHLLGIYPLCLLRKGDSPQVDRLIDDSIDNILERNRPVGDWTGWTFPWVSLLCSHAGRPETAVEMLHRYVEAHTYPNSLHENGDWRGMGTTRIRYGEPTVTLEAGFAAAAAILDLLIQSDGGILRLFPAVPEGWRDASFGKLRAEGAFVVSARLEEGRLREAVIHSEKGGTCRVGGLAAAPTVRRGTGADVPVRFHEGVASFETRIGSTYRLEPAPTRSGPTGE